MHTRVRRWLCVCHPLANDRQRYLCNISVCHRSATSLFFFCLFLLFFVSSVCHQSNTSHPFCFCIPSGHCVGSDSSAGRSWTARCSRRYSSSLLLSFLCVHFFVLFPLYALLSRAGCAHDTINCAPCLMPRLYLAHTRAALQHCEQIHLQVPLW